MAELIRVPNGLYGVIVSQTKIAKSSPEGALIYRGYSIDDLVENASFEEVAYLVSNGSLPDKTKYDEFRRKIIASMTVPAVVYEVLKRLPRETRPVEILCVGLSLLGAMSKDESSNEAKFSLAGKVPALVANGYRLREGLRPMPPNTQLGYAGNFLSMLTGRRYEDADVTDFEKLLILYMEHDFNASAFTVRVVASTRADVYSAVIAGLCALKGPLHGGANQDVVKLLAEVELPRSAKTTIKARLSKGEKIPGFGHRIYKTVDPRARIAKRLLKGLVERHPEQATVYELCDAIEATMWNEKRLPANLDFYAAPIFHALDLPASLNTSMFAMSRVFGWIAHYEEQLKEAKIIRPDAEYLGLKGLKYVPIEKR
jgi:citrate synthase